MEINRGGAGEERDGSYGFFFPAPGLSKKLIFSIYFTSIL